MLYEINPQTAFLPTVDPNIRAMSVARRRRKRQSHSQSQPQTGKNSDSTALAIVSDSVSSGAAAGGSKIGGTQTSTALILTQGESTSDGPAKGGILVVS